MKLYQALLVISGISLFYMFTGPADLWLLLGGISLFSFAFAAIAKAFHDDKIAGEQTTLAALLILAIFWIVGSRDHDD